MRYFAYGSNMSSKRLQKRVPSATFYAVARLTGHKLLFHKKSIDDSGKCNADETNNPEDVVWGVVFEIDKNEIETLDGCEGFQKAYLKKEVQVTTKEGESLEVFTYYAKNPSENPPKPYMWYKYHVLHGAIEHNLPAEYILNNIDSVQAQIDLKCHEELSLYFSIA